MSIVTSKLLNYLLREHSPALWPSSRRTEIGHSAMKNAGYQGNFTQVQTVYIRPLSFSYIAWGIRVTSSLSGYSLASVISQPQYKV